MPTYFSKRLIEIAKATRTYTITHGTIGKGNNQVRFALSAYALNPNIKVITPWCD
ncbi:argininosuccinate synthase [Bartonella sp. WD16.2]|nr:argininosuccinate synthase [Bartonella sp. WD16.2]